MICGHVSSYRLSIHPFRRMRCFPLLLLVASEGSYGTTMVADGPGGAVMVSPSVTVYKDGTYAIHGGKGPTTTWLKSTPGAPAALRGTLRPPQKHQHWSGLLPGWLKPRAYQYIGTNTSNMFTFSLFSFFFIALFFDDRHER